MNASNVIDPPAAAPPADLAIAEGHGEPEIVTYSDLTKFRNCRRKYKRSVVDKLELGEKDEALATGSAYHGLHEVTLVVRELLAQKRALDRIRGTERAAITTEDLDLTVGAARLDIEDAIALAWLENELPGWRSDVFQRKVRQNARAMFLEHRARWTHSAIGEGVSGHGDAENHDRAYRWLGVEIVFFVPLINPETGRPSRSFTIGGMVDGLLEDAAGQLWVLERKTAREASGEYVDRLWTDFQVRLYCKWLGRKLGRPIAGALYDVAVKPMIRQREGREEPVDAWIERVNREVVEKLAKYREKKLSLKKPYDPDAAELAEEEKRIRGLVSNQRDVVKAETDEEFEIRLHDRLRALNEGGQQDSFVRLKLPFLESDLEDAESEAWEITKQILDARKRNKWSKNTTQCYSFGSACPFVQDCRTSTAGSIEMDAFTRSLYVEKEPHAELRRANDVRDWLRNVFPQGIPEDIEVVRAMFSCPDMAGGPIPLPGLTPGTLSF